MRTCAHARMLLCMLAFAQMRMSTRATVVRYVGGRYDAFQPKELVKEVSIGYNFDQVISNNSNTGTNGWWKG